jgi:hypothetical protein
MRLSDAIIIYLAAAAPFCAAFFLRRAHSGGVARALAHAALAALAWPASAFLLRRPAQPAGDEHSAHAEGDDSSRRVEQAVRALVASLGEVEWLTATAAGRSDERLRFTMFSARESVLRFAGLARAARGASVDAPPTARDLELCRLAGRTGEDLRLAGRCLHRRNVLRLLLHRDRARNEVLRALADVRRAAADARPSGHAPDAAARERADALARLSRLAIDFFAAVGDARAVESATRLLDATGTPGTGADTAPRDAGREQLPEGESCTTRQETQSFADTHRPLTLNSPRG